MALAGAETEEIVGAVRSIVIGVEVGEFEDGPFVLVTVPKTAPARTCGINVPSLQELTVRVKLVPEDALIENEHPVAVPALEKSLATTVFTFCEKEIEYVIADEVFDLAGSDVVKELTVGTLS